MMMQEKATSKPSEGSKLTVNITNFVLLKLLIHLLSGFMFALWIGGAGPTL